MSVMVSHQCNGVVMLLITAADLELSVRNLVRECADVNTRWFELGLELGVKNNELNGIRQTLSAENNNMKMMQMFDKWKRSNPDASWLDVVKALEEMGENDVAQTIEARYCGGTSKNGTNH